jgi:hypothetical protein
MLLLHMQIRRYINKICDNTSFLFALVLWSLINKNTSLVTYHLIYNKSYTTVVLEQELYILPEYLLNC